MAVENYPAFSDKKPPLVDSSHCFKFPTQALCSIWIFYYAFWKSYWIHPMNFPAFWVALERLESLYHELDNTLKRTWLQQIYSRFSCIYVVKWGLGPTHMHTTVKYDFSLIEIVFGLCISIVNVRGGQGSSKLQWNLDLRKPDLNKNLDLRKSVSTTDFFST